MPAQTGVIGPQAGNRRHEACGYLAPFLLFGITLGRRRHCLTWMMSEQVFLEKVLGS